MGKKGKPVMLALLVCILFIFAIIGTRPNVEEPRYNGQPLSYWLGLYQQYVYEYQSPEAATARQAVLNVGTNALPILLRWIEYEPPAWREKLVRYLPTRVSGNQKIRNWAGGTAKQHARLAGIGFGILKTNALPAVPTLTALMNDSSAPGKRSRAILALAAMGEPAIPTLRAALQRGSRTIQTGIVYPFPLVTSEYGTNRSVPYLVEVRNDWDVLVYADPTNVIRLTAPSAQTNAPAP